MANDLRGWLSEMEALGEISRVDGADWNLELGSLTLMNGRRADGPALLFDNIKGYAPGYRVLTCATATAPRWAHLNGLPRNLRNLEIVALLRERIPHWKANAHKFPPVEVKTGPILENVHEGKDVDVFEFPTPVYHELDGGRFIGTGDAIITMDPDTGEVNLGTYRVQVHNRNTVGLFARPGTHGRIHYEKWHARGKACPVAVVAGAHPLLTRAASTSVEREYEWMGSIMGEPVEVIREEVTGLPIPASAEIVLAGWCPPGEEVMEGPFGEWWGYYATEAVPAPVVKVERVYHRHDPIILGSPPGRPRDENTLHRVLMGSAVLHNWLEESGIPDVRGVWLSEEGIRLGIIVSIKQRYAGHAKQVALLVAASRHGDSGSNSTRYIIVVDEDIDPSNLHDVFWAMLTRSDPVTDIDIIRRTWSSNMDTMLARTDKAPFNSRAIIDACKPFERLDEFPKEITVSPEMQSRVKELWGKQLGL